MAIAASSSMSDPVNGRLAVPAEGVDVVVVPRTAGEAMEKLIVTVVCDVAPVRTRVWAPVGRSLGTVNAYVMVPVDEAVVGVSVSGVECTTALTDSPAVKPPACTVTTSPAVNVGSDDRVLPSDPVSVGIVVSAAVIVYATAGLCEPLNAVGSVVVLFVGVKIATNEWLLPTGRVVVENVAAPLASATAVASVVVPS